MVDQKAIQVTPLQLEPIGCYDYKEDPEDVEHHWASEKLTSFPQRKHLETGLVSQEELEWRKRFPILLEATTQVTQTLSPRHRHASDPVEADYIYTQRKSVVVSLPPVPEQICTTTTTTTTEDITTTTTDAM